MGLAITPILTLAGSASAAVPTFPNNIAVFPDRDFVSIEGYAEHAGETATIKVTRPGVGVVGSATGVVSGTDVAFEVNHPGGVCWGNGTGLNVTPDIVAGDKVSITFADGTVDDTTTSSATVTQNMVKVGTTITVVGTFNEDPNSALPVVNRDFLEQRIIQPDLVPIIGKRDIRAVPGPLTPAPRGGYSSSLEFPSLGHFKATYVFDTQEAADVAAAADLGERAMNWEVQDAAGNRQGLTIAEFGEAGGPGMGGCPAGPADQTAPVGTASVVQTGTSALVKWTPVTAVPTADPVTGYSIEAVTDPDPTTGTQSSAGVRVGVTATQTTLTGLDTTKKYSFEVRSMAGAKLSTPFKIGTVSTALPSLALDPAPATGVVQANAVSVVSDGQVFFTTDGSPVVSGDLPSNTAQLLSGTSIPITAPVTLKVAAFNSVGNFKLLEGQFAPVTAVQPAVPTNLAAGTPMQNSVQLTWDNVALGPNLTGWQVTVYNSAGTKLATQPPVTTVPRQTVSGLSPATTYGFTVKALNAGVASAETNPRLAVSTPQATDRITISTAKWKVGDFKVVGTGDQVGATVKLYRVNTDGSIGAEIVGSSATVVAAAPPGIGDWTVRMRTNVPTTNPGRIIAKSDRGGQTAPFTVSNG